MHSWVYLKIPTHSSFWSSLGILTSGDILLRSVHVDPSLSGVRHGGPGHRGQLGLPPLAPTPPPLPSLQDWDVLQNHFRTQFVHLSSLSPRAAGMDGALAGYKLAGGNDSTPPTTPTHPIFSIKNHANSTHRSRRECTSWAVSPTPPSSSWALFSYFAFSKRTFSLRTTLWLRPPTATKIQ